MSDNGVKRSINIFRPLQGTMRGEVQVIALLLAACLLAVVGTQVGIWVLEESIDGFWLTELVFFNLPIHFWISGQFLPLLFIVLGLVFNLWMDRHELRRMEGTIRFRATGRKKGEVP
ncbi:MAG: DUF4212 domain-containing protein [Trichlorobacter sp.]|uniref:DUF4212 domain-containing protein n=1 Tax=Trichlorobacter sp. TaxID=2911007 RepID=UPI002560864D|nr:DUF4212 domain-containing protein [Trichlorobacter sp.]MDK9717326.1 DUF4212 domain-containing protein [Trichlorobacter sp.]